MSPVVAAAEGPEEVTMRCPDPWPHIPHDVPSLGVRTGFHCPGAMSEAEFERLLDEAFGGDAMSRGPN